MKHSITFETEDGFIDLLTKDIRNTTLEGTKVFVSTYQNTKHHVLGRYKDIVDEIRDAHTYKSEEFYVCTEVLVHLGLYGANNTITERRVIIPKDNLSKVTEENGNTVVHLKDGHTTHIKETPEKFLKSLKAL